MRPCQIACLMGSVLVLCLAAAHATPALQRAQDGDADAQERFFIISISPEPCTGTSGRTGTCRSKYQCPSNVGVAEGSCAWKSLGVCCVSGTTALACNSRTSATQSTFQNPRYPSPETAALGACTTTVTAGSNTCQLRLDLTEFTLANPNGEGQCITDYLQVTGATSTVPKICGVNDGQHMYVDVSPGSSVNIDVVTGSVGEEWSIDVTQIACNSADRAPSGCLQYFTTPTGTISSFNYNPSAGLVTSQLSDQSYGICIKDQSGYCSVTYEQAAGSPFSLDNDPDALAPGLPRPPLVGTDCGGDYLLIPGSTIVDNSGFAPPAPTMADRFCGLAFPGATTSLRPYRLNFVTNSGETTDGASFNEGFELTYTLNPCT